jgi:uncharacterized delta-60 repeat protein
MRNTLRKSNHSVGVPLTPANPRRNGIWFETATGRQVLALLIAMLLVSSSLVVRVKAADGDLDATFDTDGKVTTDLFGGFDAASAVAIQSDGKIVAAGYFEDFDDGVPYFALVRYESNGNPDPTFGAGGKVKIDFTNYSSIRVDVAIQNDGKIVFVGTVGAFGVQTDFGLARYDTNGNPDPAFGIGGKVTTDFFGNSDEATSVAIQNDGKIVVAGIARGISFYSDFALARYDTNGDLDATFSTGGKVTTDFFGKDDRASGVAIQSDGKIIAAGTATNGFNYDYGLARYDASGSLDATFGIGGKATTDFFGEYDAGSSVAIQSDGKIVVAGGVGGSVLTADFGIVRYDTNGNPDPTFGIGSKVTTDFFGAIDFASDVVIQSDGKIVAVGTINPDLISIEDRRDFGLARYDTNGNLDATFGIGGRVSTDFLATDFAEGVAIQPDCKIVVAGYSWPFATGNSDFALARYDSGGCLVSLPCPKSQGHWKNNPSIWPVNSLTLGSQSYTKAELLAILNTSSQTDASLILARQLIAAKLNLAGGSDPAPVSSTIAHADSLLNGFGGKLPYKVKPSSALGQAMTSDARVLDRYNNGLLTPGCAL